MNEISAGDGRAIDNLKSEVDAATGAGSVAASRALSSISSRADLRMAMYNETARDGNEPPAVDALTAEKWAKLDASEFGRIRSKERQAAAVDHIAGNARVSPDYAAALERESPSLASSVKAISDEIAAQEFARDAAMAELARSAELEAGREARASKIDESALENVARVRAIELAKVGAHLSADVTRALADVSSAAVLAVEKQATATRMPEDGDAARSRAALKRPIIETELPDEIRHRFIVIEQKARLFGKGHTDFTFRGGAQRGEVAFSDAGRKLQTTHEDKATVATMLAVAQAKNWADISVSGSDAFRREVWIEGKLKGLEVRGYTPQKIDEQVVEKLRKERAGENTITVRNASIDGGKDAPKSQDIDGDTLSPKAQAGLQSAAEKLAAKGASQRFIDATTAKLTEQVEREQVFAGKVVDFGTAPYQFHDGRNISSYVTLDTDKGRKTVWGKGVETAMKESNTAVGDEIALRKVGGVSVSVAGANGARNSVVRNEWKAEPLAQYRLQQAARPAPAPSLPERAPRISR